MTRPEMEGGQRAARAGAGVILHGWNRDIPPLSANLRDHLAATLPSRPYCSDDLQHGVYIRPQDEALKARYMQLNQRNRAATLLFDVDTSEAGAAWIDAGLPAPNLIIINPHNGHAKIGYALGVPVTTSYKGRKAPREMLERLELNMTQALGADPSFAGPRAITNNPFHTDWAVRTPTEHLYSLGELLEAIPGHSTSTKLDKAELIGEGRNNTIFEELRAWAYPLARAARTAGDEGRWQQAVRQQAHQINARFICPLRPREVDAIGKSVSKYTWKNAENFKASKIGGVKRALVESKDREPMTAQEARERMSEGRACSAQIQRDATRNKIIQAVGELIQAGVSSPSKAQIAQRAGLGVATVGRYRASLNMDASGN